MSPTNKNESKDPRDMKPGEVQPETPKGREAQAEINESQTGEGQSSLNASGTNPSETTNIGGGVTGNPTTSATIDDDDGEPRSKALKPGERDYTDVQTRVEMISGIRTSDLGNVEFSEDEPSEESVERFESAVQKASPQGAPGRGRQFANAARGMGYSVKLGR